MYASSKKDLDNVWACYAVLTRQLQDFADRNIAEKEILMAELKEVGDKAELAEEKAQRTDLAE